MKSYYNTTRQAGNSLADKVRKANTQNQRILAIMQLRRKYTPFEVHALYEQLTRSKTPITSIRRALTTLTDQGLLEKLDEKRLGIYGHDNYLWKKV